MLRKKLYCKLTKAAHSGPFITTHGFAHVAYFVAVMTEGHGFYAIIGGVMVVFSLVTVLTSSDD